LKDNQPASANDILSNLQMREGLEILAKTCGYTGENLPPLIKEKNKQKKELEDQTPGVISMWRVFSALPQMKPKSNSYIRRNNKVEIEYTSKVKPGIPSGKYARLILTFIDTQIAMGKVTNDGILQLMYSAEQFAYIITTGKDERALADRKRKRCTGKQMLDFRNALDAISSTTIHIQFSQQEEAKKVNLGQKNIRIIADIKLSYCMKHNQKEANFSNGWMRIAPEYIQIVRGFNTPPLDLQFYAKQRSTQEMDFYGYVSRIVWANSTFKKKISINKNDLFDHIGPVSETNSVHAKPAFIKKIRRILKQYREKQVPFKGFNWEEDKANFIISAGKPHVMPYKKRKSLETFVLN
jgi:hypothetical protein